MAEVNRVRANRQRCVSYRGVGVHSGPIGYATQVALDYFGTPFLALKARPNSALAEAPEFQSRVLPHFLAGCPQCPGLTLPTGHLQKV